MNLVAASFLKWRMTFDFMHISAWSKFVKHYTYNTDSLIIHHQD